MVDFGRQIVRLKGGREEQVIVVVNNEGENEYTVFSVDVDSQGNGRVYVFDATGSNFIELAGLNSRIKASGQVLRPLTSTERDALFPSPEAGLQIFNADLGKMQFFNGSAWETISSS